MLFQCSATSLWLELVKFKIQIRSNHIKPTHFSHSHATYNLPSFPCFGFASQPQLQLVPLLLATTMLPSTATWHHCLLPSTIAILHSPQNSHKISPKLTPIRGSLTTPTCIILSFMVVITMGYIWMINMKIIKYFFCDLKSLELWVMSYLSWMIKLYNLHLSRLMLWFLA